MSNELQEEIQERILRALRNLSIDCPECESMEDFQYQCGTCGGSNGSSQINVLRYLRENPDIIKKDDDKIPNNFIFDGVLYRKDFDGLFHLYPVGAEFKKENSVGDCSIGEAEQLLNSKFKKEIFYCTDDVTKKI